METYVAFLRAINLGSRRRFGKDEVAACCQAAGYEDVATHLNTGNVRLTSEAATSPEEVEARLEATFLADRGFEVPTVAVTSADLREVSAEADRFAADLAERGHTVAAQYVSFLKQTPDRAAAAALEGLEHPGEWCRVRGRAVHLAMTGADGYRTARLTNATVEKHLGPATNRNLRVVGTLVQKWC